MTIAYSAQLEPVHVFEINRIGNVIIVVIMILRAVKIMGFRSYIDSRVLISPLLYRLLRLKELYYTTEQTLEHYCEPKNVYTV